MSGGLYAYVDAADYEWLSRNQNCLSPNPALSEVEWDAKSAKRMC